jgi:hypothetical protein
LAEITVNFGGLRALDNVSLSVQPGLHAEWLILHVDVPGPTADLSQNRHPKMSGLIVAARTSTPASIGYGDAGFLPCGVQSDLREVATGASAAIRAGMAASAATAVMVMGMMARKSSSGRFARVGLPPTAA